MTAFAIIAGIVALAVGAAIAWPLWRSQAARGTGSREASLAILDEQRRELEGAHARGELDGEAFSRAIAELGRRVEEERRRARPPAARRSLGMAGWIAAACVPAVAAVIYVVAGSAGPAERPPSASPAAHRQAPQGPSARQLSASADRIAAKLRENPEDGDGWAALGRTLAAMGRFREAADALGEAERRLPGNAAILADRADVLAMAQGRRFDGEPDRLIQAALAADPRHAKALALAGSAAFDRGDYAVAARYWRRLLDILPPGDMAREVSARAAEAEKRSESAGAAAITGTIVLAGAAASPLAADDVVFVVARPRDGRGRPVAVARLQPKSFPVAFRLDDGDSLLAGAPLSSYTELVVEARLAKGGTAEPRPGDPRSRPTAVRPGDRAITLELRPPA